jgi:hypothetical protein
MDDATIDVDGWRPVYWAAYVLIGDASWAPH